MLGLVLLIGLKVTAPVFRVSKSLLKDITLSSETEKTEKETDKGDDEKNKEYFSTLTHALNHSQSAEEITHSSAHVIDYISAHYYQITSPPPDSCLQPTI